VGRVGHVVGGHDQPGRLVVGELDADAEKSLAGEGVEELGEAGLVQLAGQYRMAGIAQIDDVERVEGLEGHHIGLFADETDGPDVLSPCRGRRRIPPLSGARRTRLRTVICDSVVPADDCEVDATRRRPLESSSMA
jgi:hypothetical protein